MKKASKKSARRLKQIPRSDAGPGVLCLTASGEEFRICPGPIRGKHTLWQKTKEGYLEVAEAASPNDLYTLINWAG